MCTVYHHENVKQYHIIRNTFFSTIFLSLWSPAKFQFTFMVERGSSYYHQHPTGRPRSEFSSRTSVCKDTSLQFLFLNLIHALQLGQHIISKVKFFSFSINEFYGTSDFRRRQIPRRRYVITFEGKMPLNMVKERTIFVRGK